MMGINIVTANFNNGGRQSITRKLYQYDYGQKINIKGLKLPSTFEVHISNDHKANTAQIYIGNNNEIEIPDKFLLSGQDIYIWIFLHSTATDGQTRYTITIPVQKKPKPESEEPAEVERNTIDQLIAALENNLNEMRQATEDAKTTMDQATAAAKEQMQLTIDKANDTVSKYPKIVDDYWYVYDVENQVWVNTEIKALAVDGIGIENIIYNNDYTITINLTDGTSYTTNSIRGEKGDKGDTGATPNIKIKTTETIAPNQYASVRIEGTPENPELTFRIPKGEKGDKGDTGAMPQISIGTVETLLPHRAGYVTQTGTAENPILNFGLVKGETGEQGLQGIQGQTGPKGDKGDIGPMGPKGDKGDKGETGSKGDTGDIGPQGPKGETGPQGPKGDKGDPGDVSIAQLNTTLATKADIIINSATGTIVSFSDGADNMPIKSCVMNIEPIQEGEGDPSPDNVRPISGRTGLSVVRCGKNLLWKARQSSIMNGITWTLNDDGSITASGTSTGRSYVRIIISTRDLYTLPKGTYTYSLTPTGSDYANIKSLIGSYKGDKYYKNVCVVGSSNNFANVFVWNDSDLTAVLDIAIEIAQANKTVNCTVYPQIELGSTATDYEPYKGSTYSVNWESEVGTVYGGYVDAVSGKLTITHRYWTDDGSRNWLQNQGGSFYVPLEAEIPVQVEDGCYCNYCKYVVGFSGLTVFARANGLMALNSGWASVYPDVSSLKAAFTQIPLQVVYKMATPIEIQLTGQEIRTLLGVNNIWSDGGDMEVKYPVDTKTYIDTKIAEAIAAAMA